MRIQTIEIHNFRAFYGKHVIPVDGKNLFIYGENGSGKSSLYYALNDFFESAVLPAEEVQDKLRMLRNVFTDEAPLLKVSFVDKGGTETTEQVDLNRITTQGKHKIELANAFHQRGAYTYKKLYSQSESGFHPYDQVIRKVFWEFKGGRKTTFGYAFNALVSWLSSRETDYQAGVKQDLYENLCQRAAQIIELLNRDLPNFLKYFEQDLEVAFQFSAPKRKSYWRQKPEQIYHSHFETDFRNGFSSMVKYRGRTIQEPQHFLNEARRSALSLAMIATAIKASLIETFPKILLLDDIFIGMDSQNRKPFLRLLREQFHDFQIVMMTYDRHWYEIGKQNLMSDSSDWRFIEFYSEAKKVITQGGREEEIAVPFLYLAESHLTKARKHFVHHHYGEAANLLRKQCESLLKTEFLKDVLWHFHCDGPPSELRLQLEAYRKLLVHLKRPVDWLDQLISTLTDVLNPQSHHGYEKPLYKNDLEKAFDQVSDLGTSIDSLVKGKLTVISYGYNSSWGFEGSIGRLISTLPNNEFESLEFYCVEPCYKIEEEFFMGKTRTFGWQRLNQEKIAIGQIIPMSKSYESPTDMDFAFCKRINSVHKLQGDDELVVSEDIFQDLEWKSSESSNWIPFKFAGLKKK